MIEKIIRDYLISAQNIPVFIERIPKVDKFYLIEKTGSSTENMITQATIAIQSYAPSKYEAAQLNDALISYMDQATVLNEIAAVDLNSDYDYTDTTTKEYRYQAVFDITHY